MANMQFTTMDRIFSEVYRDLDGMHFEEVDIVELAGKALEHMRAPQVTEQAVVFLQVENYEVDFPKNVFQILQIAKDNGYTGESSTDYCTCLSESTEEEDEEEEGGPVPLDCHGMPTTDYTVAYYRPFLDLSWSYDYWTTSSFYRDRFTPVRLSNNTFFNTLVCKETDESPYQNCIDEYSIVGTMDKKIRFSFETGLVAVSYLKIAVDDETGYPLIPDDVSYIEAIGYYIKWKIGERLSWSGREGYEGKIQYARSEWLRYAKQAKNKYKMPQSLDDYQDLLEESHFLLPRLRRYYGFFGKLGKEELRPPNNNIKTL